ncbi:MAG: hypothetical protein OXE99_08155 [Cellvibrionales bacterium]|nr:hypothetical protein [Cellvibrionales bacterium]
MDIIQKHIENRQEKILRLKMKSDIVPKSTIYTESNPGKWINATIDYGAGEIFAVFLGLVFGNEGRRIIIKPKDSYRKSNYESLFKFGCDCEGFTRERRVELYEEEAWRK